VSADIAHTFRSTTDSQAAAERSVAVRARILLALGPLTAAAGVAWALFQPWRLTLLHPAGQGFWWLFAEPPLYVVLVGLLFRFALAPGIVADLEETQVPAPEPRGRVTGSGASELPESESEAVRSGEEVLWGGEPDRW
jgi:hypothetical protein